MANDPRVSPAEKAANDIMQATGLEMPATRREIQRLIEAAYSQPVAPGPTMELSATDSICIPLVTRATGRLIPDLTKREHVCEWQSSVKLAAPPAVSTPRCPKCGSGKLSLWGQYFVTCADCGAGAEIGEFAELAQFFQPDSQPSPAQPRCLGYPKCDGMLPGEPHEKDCPAFEPAQPSPEGERK